MKLKISRDTLPGMSVPLQLAASTLIGGLMCMKAGEVLYGEMGQALGLLIGLVLGFFGYIAVIIKKEQ
ncbi:MAG: hypothetical protein HXS47_04400 [Theionarchaea archaeon]|nr:hypothetical protein [Theionarchaea archaeon]